MSSWKWKKNGWVNHQKEEEIWNCYRNQDCIIYISLFFKMHREMQCWLTWILRTQCGTMEQNTHTIHRHNAHPKVLIRASAEAAWIIIKDWPGESKQIKPMGIRLMGKRAFVDRFKLFLSLIIIKLILLSLFAGSSLRITWLTLNDLSLISQLRV